MQRNSVEEIEAYTRREVEDAIFRLTRPNEISWLDFLHLMHEVKLPRDIAGVMWEEYVETNGTISKDDVMVMLGLNPDLREVVRTCLGRFPHLQVQPIRRHHSNNSFGLMSAGSSLRKLCTSCCTFIRWWQRGMVGKRWSKNALAWGSRWMLWTR